MHRLAIIGDSPDITTGFSCITRAAIKYFNQSGWEVSALACLDSKHLSPMELMERDYWHWSPPPDDELGLTEMFVFARHVQPDVILLIGDPGSLFHRIQRMINPPILGGRTKDGTVQWQYPVMSNFPIEGLPLNQVYVEQANLVTQPVTWTTWGADVLRSSGVPNIEHAPLCVEKEEIYPLPPELIAHIKRLFGMGNTFNIMALASNRRKSRLPVLIEAAAALKERGMTDFQIYIHTSPQADRYDPRGGFPLGSMVERFGAFYNNKTLVRFPHGLTNTNRSIYPKHNDMDWFDYTEPFLDSRTKNEMWSKLDLNTIYNLHDMFVDTCANHGWSLPLCEAMQVGIPTATVNDGTVRTHLYQDCAYMMAPDPETHDWWHNGVVFPLISTNTVVETILRFREDQGLCGRLVKQGHTFIDGLDWQDSMTKMVRLAENIIID